MENGEKHSDDLNKKKETIQQVNKLNLISTILSIYKGIIKLFTEAFAAKVHPSFVCGPNIVIC